jgi:hypothetical protein
LRGGVYSAELMLRAIDVGDPTHIAAACGLEAIKAAAANQPARAQRMIDIARAATQASGVAETRARATGMFAICRQLQGRWKESLALARESQELYRSCARVAWDHAIMIWWEMTAMAPMGHLAELGRKIPEALRDAEARGDVYAATSFRTYKSSWAWLGADRPDLAEMHVDTAEREWTPDGYQFQHWHMTCARGDIDLYRATPHRSLRRIMQEWGRARLVRQMQEVRADMLYSRARLALAAANHDYQPQLIQRAVSDARALIREGMPYTVALGNLVLAGAASFEDRAEAMRRLHEVEPQFLAADMQLHAEVARARRAELSVAADADVSRSTALRAIQALGAKRPEAFVQILAPIKRP